MEFTLPEQCKVVMGIPPQHANVAVTGQYVSLKGYAKMTIIVLANNLGAAGTQDFHLYKATSIAATGEVVDQSMANWWLNADTASGAVVEPLADTLVKQAANTVAQITVAQKYEMIVIEVDARDYPGYDCFCAKSDAGNAANFYAVVYILHGARHQQATPPTAIFD